MTPIDRAALAQAFEADRRLLWGLCYRMTGNAADADDAVQDTFTRALERPPARQDEPWRPWLVRVALNRSRDLLRRRRRREYIGPWLPSPIDTGDEATPVAYESPATEGRYDLVESVSMAFLVALEALTPAQRAVLLLRDVFDYSVAETADALGITAANVKTTHHRARRAMAGYDAGRRPPTRDLQATARTALERFLTHLGNHDVPGIQAMLAEDVRLVTDAGGQARAPLLPIYGREKVMRFFAKVGEGAIVTGIRPAMLNAMPAVIVDVSHTKPRVAPRFTLSCEIDAAGRITCVTMVLATSKLTKLS